MQNNHTMKNQENLEGIVSKLKMQGVEAGENEKKRLIDLANKEVEKMIADAEEKSKNIIEKAKSDAAQIEKNSKAAIAQSARDMIEATKITITNHLKNVFGKQCGSLINQDEYLGELLKVVLDTIKGDKTVKVSPELVKKMQTFITNNAIKDGVVIKPLANSEAKISVECTENGGIQFVLTSKDVEDGLFSLLNQDLVDRINNIKEE